MSFGTSQPTLDAPSGSNVTSFRPRRPGSAGAEGWIERLRAVPYVPLPPDCAGGVLSERRACLHRPATDLPAIIGRIAGRWRCSRLTVGLTVLAAVLHRLTGEAAFAVATELAHPGEQNADRLVVPVEPGRAPTLRHLRDGIAEALRSAISLPGLSYDALCQALLPAGGGRLCAVSFTLLDAAAGLPPGPRWTRDAAADFDVALGPSPSGWAFSCRYAADAYAESSAAGLLDALAHGLRALDAGDGALDGPVTALPLIDAATRAALIACENATGAAYPRDAALPALFAAQAARRPHAIAVSAGSRSLTYRALDRDSNRLARHLRSRGIGAGALVGVCLDRSVELVTALVAVMKAGAAYVPLDPHYPAQRLAQVLDDAGVAAILTADGPAAALPPGKSEHIHLDRQAREIAAHSRHPLDLAIPADHAAYVIFTSGSTGRPKGVRIPHGALTNLLCAMAATPGLTEQDVLLSVTTIAFDIAALELFLPLAVGARVELASRTDAADGRALAELLRASGATVLQATPVTWQLLLEAGWRGGRSLKMLCGGEALPRRLADRLLATGGELWNMYGPTETTIWSSALRVTAGSEAVRIGPPIANTVFHVLDESLALLPPGAVGELFIGGDGVADGYCNRPDLTAGRFVADPFRPGGRLYRTGDLVRRHPAGGLVFLGRRDQQIKLRGVRIELGDIEAALLAAADVAEAAVIATCGADGAVDGLAAFVTPRAGASLTTAALQRHLAQTLPVQMRPASTTILARLPRTPNGKLDRAALPALQQGAPPAAQSPAPKPPAAPPSDLAGRLAVCWADALGLDTVGPDDNFFELGGHSLIAAGLLARIEAALQRRVPFALLSRAPTPRSLAAVLTTGDLPTSAYQLIELQAARTGTPIFAINHPWLCGSLSRLLGPEQPFYAVQVFEEGGAREVEATAAKLVEVIRHVRPHGPYALLGLCAAGTLAYEVAQRLGRAGETVRLTVLVDSWAPDFEASLSRPRAWLADWSMRIKMFGQDFRRDAAHSPMESLRFLARRAGGFARKHTIDWIRPPAPATDPVAILDAACARYRPKPLASRLLVFHRADMPRGRFLDPNLGWDAHAAAGLRVVSLPGDHFEMFRGEGAQLMATEIALALTEAVAPAEAQAAPSSQARVVTSSLARSRAGGRIASAPA